MARKPPDRTLVKGRCILWNNTWRPVDRTGLFLPAIHDRFISHCVSQSHAHGYKYAYINANRNININIHAYGDRYTYVHTYGHFYADPYYYTNLHRHPHLYINVHVHTHSLQGIRGRAYVGTPRTGPHHAASEFVIHEYTSKSFIHLWDLDGSRVAIAIWSSAWLGAGAMDHGG